MKKQILLTAIFMLFLGQVFAQFKLQKLQVNYQTTPLGTDLVKPQFSWQMTNATNKRGQAQIAYQIEVTDEQNRVVWNSKRVESDLSHAVQYKGESLKPTTRYNWKLTVWDNFKAFTVNNSWFETGFLNTKIDAWSGASWIGGAEEDMPLYSHYLSVFKLQYDVQLDKNSSKASFLFGANDSRLMNKSLNLMAVERKKNESYVSLELDISSLSDDANSTAKLNIYRIGYTNDDKADIPLKSISIPQSIVNQVNKYAKHTILTECNFGVFEFFVDGTDEAHKIQDKSMTPTSRFAPSGFNLNPVGAGNNYISFPMLADIGFKTEANQTAIFSNIQVKNLRYPSNAIFSENLSANKGIFEGLSIENGAYKVAANTLITANPSRNAMPMLRNVFSVNGKNIKKARLYVTARGIYEIYLNGQ